MAKELELYCQSPACQSPLIEKGSSVAVDAVGRAYHPNMTCPYVRARREIIKTGQQRAVLLEMKDYGEALAMAKKGKLEFDLLEQEAMA